MWGPSCYAVLPIIRLENMENVGTKHTLTRVSFIPPVKAWVEV